MKTWPDVSIVIPTWRGQALLAEFLPSVVAAANYYETEHLAKVEIIIVDDASNDNSVAWLHQHYPAITVVARQENGGFACAANSGFAAAKYPIVLLLNNDIRIELAAIAPLVRHFTNDQLFAVSCKAYRLDSDLFDGAGKLAYFQKGHWHIFLNYDVLPTKQPNPLIPCYNFVASGGYAAFDRAKLQQLGGFCELLSPYYWEDVDLCYRAWKRGWQIYYEPTSIVHHKSSATIGKQVPAPRVRLVAERNRLLMHWINLHDKRWLLSHIGWVTLKLLAAIITFDLIYVRAVGRAIWLLPQVRTLHNQERALIKFSDRQLAKLFNQLTKNDWVVVIRNPQDYYDYVALKRQLEQH